MDEELVGHSLASEVKSGEKAGTRTFISNLGGIIRSARTLCPNTGGNITFLNPSNQGNKSKFQEGTEHSNRKVGAVFIASSNFSFILILRTRYS